MYKRLILSAAMLTSVAMAADSNVASTGSSSGTSASSVVSKSASGDADLLFVQQATNASLSDTADSDGCRTLTMWPVVNDENKIHYFSNEPDRIAGSLNPGDFVTAWNAQKSSDGVSEFKPNVALLGVVMGKDENSKPESYARSATLSNPAYDSSSQKMTYTACPIAGDSLPAMSDLKHSAVFIDAISLSTVSLVTPG